MYKNVHYITAGAGAGKTTTLVNVIKQLIIENGADPGRMMLTTYTKAAANEFRERSKVALIKNNKPDEAIALDKSAMGTVHSIASRYINRYWYLLGMAPDVKPADKTSSEILMNLSLDGLVSGEDTLLLKQYAKSFGITKLDGGYNYDFWKTTLQDLFKKVRGYGFGKEQIDGFRERTKELLSATFHQNGNQAILDSAKPCFDTYLGFASVINDYGTDKAKEQFKTNCITIQGILSLDVKKLDCKRLKDLANIKWGYKPALDNIYPEKQSKEEEMDACIEELKATIKRLSDELVPDECKYISEVSNIIFDMLERWMVAYEKIKKEYAVIDYADMEQLFLELLQKTEVQEDIRQSVDYLFVDEFQDTTPIQTRIFEALSNLVKQSWFVGDRKQAIYGFAGSDSGLVSELARLFPAPEKSRDHISDLKKDTNGNSAAILDTSRRSVPSLVDAANKIFTECFSEIVSGYDKDRIPEEQITLRPDPTRQDPAQRDVLYHVCLNGENTTEQLDALACFVFRMSEDPSFAKAGYTLSDIAILTRGNTQAKTIANALARKGIKTSFFEGKFKDFSEAPEVALILSLLKLSEGLSGKKTRAEIRKLLLDEDLATLAQRVVNSQNDLGMFKGLDEYAKSLKTASLPDRIDALIARFDLLNECASWGMGETRKGHLLLLRKAAADYTASASLLCGAADLRGFLQFLPTYDADIPFDNSADGVKVLTYHKSKGLDWKIVILTELDKYKETTSISGNTLQGDSRNPSGMISVPILPKKVWVAGCIQANPEALQLLQLIQAKQLGEEKRLLYVGFTRAKDVVITATSSADAEVIRRCCPTARKRNVTGIPAGKVDIWGIPGHESTLIDAVDDPKLTRTQNPPCKYKDAGLDLKASSPNELQKFISPSQYHDEQLEKNVDPKRANDFGHRTDIPHPTLEDNVFGDAVHHIFAACTPGQDEANRTIAAQTLAAFGIDDIDGAKKIVSCFNELYSWLEGIYGPIVEMEKELPFRYTNEKGQVFSGNMDLVLRTEKGSVLIDYKTFPGKKEDLFDPASDHFAGKYASQLSVYAKALEARDKKAPLACILYYPVEGLVLTV